MKKIYCILMNAILLLSSAVLPEYNKTDAFSFITNGYTEEGIYYEVHGEYAEPRATTLPVTRYVTYQGNIIPPEQLPWEETAGGIRYSGILTRNSYIYMRKDNITMATYTGTLNYYLYQ